MKKAQLSTSPTDNIRVHVDGAYSKHWIVSGSLVGSNFESRGRLLLLFSFSWEEYQISLVRLINIMGSVPSYDLNACHMPGDVLHHHFSHTRSYYPPI
jgi:hypothetical protein